MSEATQSKYSSYLMEVATSYANNTADQIRSVLAEGQTLGWSKEEYAEHLRDIMNTDEWRVQRMARTEEHRAANRASLDAMIQLMNETNTDIYKVWHTNSTEPCEFCQALNGRRILVTESFLGKDDSIIGADGGIFVNTFVDVEAADLHPNCYCYLTYEVDEKEKENKND